MQKPFNEKVLAIVFLIAVVYGIWWLFLKDKRSTRDPKAGPVKVLDHSAAFNASVDSVMNGYFDMKAAFVDADTVKIKEEDKKFLTLIDGLKMDEISHDSSAIFQSASAQLNDIKASATAMLGETDLTEMRQDFRMVSENLYPFLKTIKYEGPPLYWQNCPMAFGDDKEGNWISNTKEIINPYLGKNHPQYKNSMLHCGEIKDTIK